MRVEILGEYGYNQAMRGLSLNKSQPVSLMPTVADRLAGLDKGHNKFLESMQVWLEIKAPRYWWQDFDTYRIGVTKQSASTNHTGLKREYTPADFTEATRLSSIHALNTTVNLYNSTQDADERRALYKVFKANMPEGLLQTRVVCLNYKVLRGIYAQRKNHPLEEFQTFLKAVLSGVEYPLFITAGERKGNNDGNSTD